MAEANRQRQSAGPSSALMSEILQASGLSQAELARRAGIPRSVMNVYAHGHRRPNTDALVKIAAAGGLDLKLVPRPTPVNTERAGRILVQVLELAEALPFKTGKRLKYPRLPDLQLATATKP